MRTSTRTPFDRSRYNMSEAVSAGRLSSRNQSRQGDVISPGSAEWQRSEKSTTGNKYNKSDYARALPVTGRVEDTLAKKLGFKGKFDPKWIGAKHNVRMAKFAVKTLGKLIGDKIASDALDQIHNALAGLKTGTNAGAFVGCSYPNGHGGGFQGYFNTPGALCVQGQGAGLPTILPGWTTGYILVMENDTSILPGPAQTNYAVLAGNLPKTIGTISPTAMAETSVVHAVDPMTLPIMKLMPLAKSETVGLPFTMLGQSTTESSARSYGTQLDVAVMDKVITDVAIVVRTTTGISTETKTSVSLEPSLRQRVKAGTREKKSVVRLPAVVAMAMNAVTETGDAVTAIYEALPEKIQKREMARRHGKPPKLTDKARLIYQHASKLDVNKVILNLMMNELEDRVIGTLSQKANKGINKHWTRPVGVTFGRAL